MNRTKIEYLDYTWNPIVGCTGLKCAVRQHCWAMSQSKRRKHACIDCYIFKPHYHWERLRQPLKVKKSSRIGVGFEGDLFDSEFGIVANQQIFGIIEQAKQHTFVCLTKQSKNMLVFNQDWQVFPPNLWMGVTVNLEEDLCRIEDLKRTDAKIKFVSFEPLYEDLSDVNLEGIDWIIIGGQTRPKLLPSYPWVLGLIQKAKTHNLPVFIKNNLKEIMASWSPLREYPEQLMDEGRLCLAEKVCE